MFSRDVPNIFGYSRGVLAVFGGVSDMFGGVLDVSGCFLTDSRDVRKIFLICFDDFWNCMVLFLLKTGVLWLKTKSFGPLPPLRGSAERVSLRVVRVVQGYHHTVG